MLKNIKDIINRKKDFLEAADIIFEDGVGNLDDIIVLGEDTKTDYIEEDEDEDIKKEEENENDENEKEQNDEIDGNSDDIMNEPVDSNDENNDTENNEFSDQDDNLLDSDIDNELPTPVGRQTGEPIDGIDDILDVSIDLKSNTINDILPVPPGNASEAIASDEMNQHVSSGFENDDDIMNEPVDSNDGSFSEAISLDSGDTPDENTDSSNSTETDDVPTDDTSEQQPTEENEVTSAVRDKVAEADEEIPTGDGSNFDKEILSKLGNVTKGVEDVKKMIINRT